MAETKFTPGPWIVGFGSAGARIEWDGEYRNDGWIIASELEGPDKFANAHLIAAAPDLFRALEAMLPAFVANFTYEDERAVRAFAALAKARGEA